MPVIGGAGSNSTAAAVEQTRRATETGVDAILSVAPYYNRPSQLGLDAHFRAVAAATDLPVFIYDIPGRTGRKVSTETILRLAHEVPNIVGLKDAAANPAETARLIARAPSGFEVYSGDDPLMLPLLAVGAVGTISVASHWVGRQTRRVDRRVRQGRRRRPPAESTTDSSPPTTTRRATTPRTPFPPRRSCGCSA